MTDPPAADPVMVISHERGGTRFVADLRWHAWRGFELWLSRYVIQDDVWTKVETLVVPLPKPFAAALGAALDRVS